MMFFGTKNNNLAVMPKFF